MRRNSRSSKAARAVAVSASSAAAKAGSAAVRPRRASVPRAWASASASDASITDRNDPAGSNSSAMAPRACAGPGLGQTAQDPASLPATQRPAGGHAWLSPINVAALHRADATTPPSTAIGQPCWQGSIGCNPPRTHHLDVMPDQKTPPPAAQQSHPPAPAPPTPKPLVPAPLPPAQLAIEIGGAPGPDPTRYGDWQHKGRVTDF